MNGKYDVALYVGSQKDAIVFTSTMRILTRAISCLPFRYNMHESDARCDKFRIRLLLLVNRTVAYTGKGKGVEHSNMLHVK